jgi:hypothetical protein
MPRVGKPKRKSLEVAKSLENTGAPRSMKMGNIRSPWRYDVVLESTLAYPMTCAPLRGHSDETHTVPLFRYGLANPPQTRLASSQHLAHRTLK